ncbi:TPA: hypothetical protein U0J96_000429 [Streptococcus suis]|nr:hypothetical protein [Streptococcus suis]
MNWPEYQVPKAGIATSFFALIVVGGAETSIRGICILVAGIASRSTSRH